MSLALTHLDAARPEALSPALLADIADGLAASEDLWRSAVVHDDAERRPVRLVTTDSYEVWVIGWMPGQGVDLHDHGDSIGHIVVVDGTLTEVEPRSTGGEPFIHPLEAGDGHHLPLGLVHDIVNTGTEPATSIHVYSPPLTEMTFYEPSTLVPTRIDAGTWDDAVESAVDTAPAIDQRVSRALHPSQRRG